VTHTFMLALCILFPVLVALDITVCLDVADIAYHLTST
jgi:hypothetical protein